MTQPDLFTQSFYNTNNSSQAEISQYGVECANQQDRVLAYFKQVRQATALQVIGALNLHPSSVRRSMSNLAKAGRLVKTEITVYEITGKKAHIYSLSNI